MLRGEPSNIALLLRAVEIKNARVADFEVVNRETVRQSTGFSSLHIGSRHERKALIVKFLAERTEQILVINDIDSKSFFAMFDSRLYSEFSYNSASWQRGDSIERVFENWETVIISLQEGQHVYVRVPDGRDFVLTSLGEIMTIQQKISARNKRWEQAGLIAPAPQAPATTDVVGETKSEPAPAVARAYRSDITLQEFTSQNDLALAGFGKRQFYLLNPLWIARARARDVLSTLTNRNPGVPPLSKSARSSLVGFVEGKRPEGLVQRSAAVVTGPAAAEGLIADHALDKTIAVTQRERSNEPDQTSIRIRYVLVPIPYEPLVAEVAIKPSAPPAASPAVAESVAVPYSEGIGVTEFMLHRDRAIGPKGKQPLDDLNPVRVLQKKTVGAYFFIVSADYARRAKPGAIFKLIEQQFPTLPRLSGEDQKFLDAMRTGNLAEVPHSTHNLGELSGQGTNAILETAWIQQIPIVAKRANVDPIDADYLLIPIRKPSQ